MRRFSFASSIARSMLSRRASLARRARSIPSSMASPMASRACVQPASTAFHPSPSNAAPDNPPARTALARASISDKNDSINRIPAYAFCSSVSLVASTSLYRLSSVSTKILALFLPPPISSSDAAQHESRTVSSVAYARRKPASICSMCDLRYSSSHCSLRSSSNRKSSTWAS